MFSLDEVVLAVFVLLDLLDLQFTRRHCVCHCHGVGRGTLSDTRLLLGLAEPASNQVEEVETRRSIHTICTYLSQVITSYHMYQFLSMHINAVKLPVSIL